MEPISLVLADGQQVQELLKDKDTFSFLVEEVFMQLDTDGSGTLTASELKPAVETLKQHLQLPPWGGEKRSAGSMACLARGQTKNLCPAEAE